MAYLESPNRPCGAEQIIYEPLSRTGSTEHGGRYVQFAADGSDFGSQCIKLGKAIVYAAEGAAEYYRSKGESGTITITNLTIDTMLLCLDPTCSGHGRVAVVAKFDIRLPPPRNTFTPQWQKNPGRPYY
ncbi:MAG: hypothetical protein M0R22_13100 [Dehalococcoidia bacterium]|nr:hypothetical protein [Dehalococcoidia bacterium]